MRALGNYVMVDPDNPEAIQRRPYGGKTWPAQLQQPAGVAMMAEQLGSYYSAAPMVQGNGMGADVAPQAGATTDQIKLILITIGTALLLYWLFFSKNAPLRNTAQRRNPGKGKNRIVRVFKECNGGWYYKLMHKRARRHGPFDSGCAASDAAVDAGFKVAEV